MNVIVGFEDFKNLIKDNEKITKENWKENYYSKYKEVFDAMLKYLYFMNLDDFLKFIENINFNEILKSSEDAMNNNLIDKVLELINKGMKILDFYEDFNIYFLVGLEHVDGTSLPDDKPFIYFGLERLNSLNLDFLVPHEFNHLVRLFKMKDKINSLKVIDYIIFEGLATYFSLYFNNLEINKENEAKSLIIPIDVLEKLYENEDKIKNEIFNLIHNDMNNQIMFEYFTFDGEKRLKQGYFIGLKIIENVVNRGYDIQQLTTLDSTDILKIYYK